MSLYGKNIGGVKFDIDDVNNQVGIYIYGGDVNYMVI